MWTDENGGFYENENVMHHTVHVLQARRYRFSVFV